MTDQESRHIDRRILIVLDLDHAGKALQVAKQIAEQTGQIIVVRDADGFEIDTVYPTRH